MKTTNFYSQTMRNTAEEFQSFLEILIPNEILGIIFDQIVNQKSQPLRDISSILLTCKKWERILKTNPCISLLQTLFQIKYSDRFTIMPPSECIATDQKKNFTSKELKLIDRALRETTTFEKLLMIDSTLFQSKSLFLSLLYRYIWNPKICKNSINKRIKMIAENQLSILNSLISGSDEEKLTIINNDFIEKFYSGAQDPRWYEVQTAVISTLKKFRNLNNKKVFIQVARCFGASVFDIDESFKKDREIVLAAVQPSGWALQYADQSLKKDQEIVLAAVQADSYALQFADEALKQNREIVLAAVQEDGNTLQYADETLKKDREIVLAAVKQYGMALQYADENLKKDIQIVLAAFKQGGWWALQCADETIQEIILAAIQENG